MSKTGNLLIALATAQDGKLPLWIQLFPKGAAKPRDSREAWTITDPAQIALASAQFMPGLIDVDHTADQAVPGTTAPAFGWIEEVKGEGPEGEPGVWGRVAWTMLGKTALADRQYRYISPAFYFDDAREVQAVFRATLTNNPALHLKALATAERVTKTETLMDLTKIAAALALAATATEAEILAAINGKTAEHTAFATRLKTIGAGAGLTGAIDDDAAIALATKLKTPPADKKDGFVPVAEFDKLAKDFATLQSSISGNQATAAVDAAIEGGRITPALREWAVDYATRDPKGFAAFIGKAPKLLGDGSLAPTEAAKGELTSQQVGLCTSMGIKPEDFKATRDKQLNKKEAA